MTIEPDAEMWLCPQCFTDIYRSLAGDEVWRLTTARRQQAASELADAARAVLHLINIVDEVDDRRVNRLVAALGALDGVLGTEGEPTTPTMFVPLREETP